MVEGEFMTLNELKKGQKAIVVGFEASTELDPNMVFDQGIYEGAEIILCNISPFGRDPIAIEVNGSKLALRKALASMIKVDITS